MSSRVAAPLLATAVICLDQATKYLVSRSLERGSTTAVLPGIDLVNVRNEGVAFGLFAGKGITVSAIAVVVLAALLLVVVKAGKGRRSAWLAAGLLFGGAMGNLIDRARIGSVIDFLDLPLWPPFNLADIAVTLGAIGLALAVYRGSASGATR